MWGFKQKQSQATPADARIPVLCTFVQEDGVWNASAEHLPVAVFGDTFEEARENLCNAVVGHIQSMAEAGRMEEVLTLLRRRAEDHMLVNEIAGDSVISKMLVPLKPEFACA